MNKYPKHDEIDFYAAFEKDGKYKVGIFYEGSIDPYHTFEPCFKSLEDADVAASYFHDAYKIGFTEGYVSAYTG